MFSILFFSLVILVVVSTWNNSSRFSRFSYILMFQVLLGFADCCLGHLWILMNLMIQWEFQDPKMEVPTIYKPIKPYIRFLVQEFLIFSIEWRRVVAQQVDPRHMTRPWNFKVPWRRAKAKHRPPKAIPPKVCWWFVSPITMVYWWYELIWYIYSC